jgi:GNAT superfamily N-acetyltransferase
VAQAIVCGGPEDVPECARIDDDAGFLFGEAGMDVDLPTIHPFSVAERERWRRSAALGRLFFARDDRGAPVGFVVFDVLDGAAYVDQLSVQKSAMRRGIGRALLHHAIEWAAPVGNGDLWLTTYGHLPWNRPFYESEGFVVVPEPECIAGVRAHLAEERSALPDPDQRVGMRRLRDPAMAMPRSASATARASLSRDDT